MIITLETTKTRRRIKLTVNRVYQGVFGLQRILERVSMLFAGHQADDPEDLPHIYTIAMDALDYAAAAIERLGSSEGAQQKLEERLANPKLVEADYQALLEEVRSNPELRHSWDHASRIFGSTRACPSKASVLGTIAAGLAGAYSLLGDDISGEELRGLYEEAEPLVTLLLSVQQHFDTAPEPLISAPGGDA